MSRSRVLVVGASGLIGSTVADLLDQRGHEVVRSSRSSGERADLTDPASIEALYERIGPVDAVIAATGSVPFKPLPELGVEDFRTGILDKALGQIALVTLGAPRLRPGASFTLTSGILAQSPVATGAVASAANGAIDAFVRAAATTLPGSARINAVSPTVLAEAEEYHASFPGFVPVPAATVAQAFVRSVEGVETGQVFAV